MKKNQYFRFSINFFLKNKKIIPARAQKFFFSTHYMLTKVMKSNELCC